MSFIAYACMCECMCAFALLQSQRPPSVVEMTSGPADCGRGGRKKEGWGAQTHTCCVGGDGARAHTHNFDLNMEVYT